MWIPAQTTRPPRSVARRAVVTSGPTGAKMIEESSGQGASSSLEPAQAAPSSSASSWAALSPGLVNAATSRPSWTATWQMMWAAAPKP